MKNVHMFDEYREANQFLVDFLYEYRVSINYNGQKREQLPVDRTEDRAA